MSDLHVNKHCPFLCFLLFYFFSADVNLVFLKASRKDCYTITKVLRVYENAMGQMINLDKSSFFLISKNINEKNDI